MGKSVKELVTSLIETIEPRLEVIENVADMTPRQYNEHDSIMAPFSGKKVTDTQVEILVRKRYEKDFVVTRPINHITLTANDFNQVRSNIMRPVVLAPAKDTAKFVIVYDSSVHVFDDIFVKYTLAKAFAIIDYGYYDQTNLTLLRKNSTDVNIDRYAVRELGITQSQFKSIIDIQYTEENLKTQLPNIDSTQIENIKEQRIDMVINII